MNHVERYTEVLNDHTDSPLCFHPEDDSKVSTERLDDTVAAITFAVTIITIALGFLFNL